MKKLFGIVGLLLFVAVLTALLSDRFLSAANLENLIRRSALFGVISIGAAFVIVTGGIDLSIGSVICLAGCLLPWLLVEHGWSVWTALPFVLALSATLGLAHGLLITRLRLQPFVVTLCGLLLYRGIARGITGDQTVGFGAGHLGLRDLGAGRWVLGEHLGIPAPCFYLVVVAALAAVFFNRTIWGRYLRALGRNEEAARLSGIPTARPSDRWPPDCTGSFTLRAWTTPTTLSTSQSSRARVQNTKQSAPLSRFFLTSERCACRWRM